MKLTTAIVAGTAVLATLGGGLAAATATAGPEPSPTPTAAASGAAGRGAGVAWFYRALTGEQRDCLVAAAVQRPEGRLTEDQRAELKARMLAALQGCGVSVPERLAQRPRLGQAWGSLTTQQQQCLADAELSRPVGRLGDAERAAVRQAVRDQLAACGIGR